jgi:AcrR family transcriptional regulator
MATTELSAGTRNRILEAAWERVRDHGAGAVDVKAIAAAAGVSRQLVYFHFENRAGLLTAMARHHDHASGFRRRVAASRSLPPVEGLETLLREWCAYVRELMPVARALEAAAVMGDEGATAWRDRMADLREAFRLALARVEEEGRLAPGWSVERAADWACARVLPGTYAQLVDELGWTRREFTERTTASVMAELVAPQTS